MLGLHLPRIFILLLFIAVDSGQAWKNRKQTCKFALALSRAGCLRPWLWIGLKKGPTNSIGQEDSRAPCTFAFSAILSYRQRTVGRRQTGRLHWTKKGQLDCKPRYARQTALVVESGLSMITGSLSIGSFLFETLWTQLQGLVL